MSLVEFFTPRDLGPKSWGTELLVAETSHYIGKVMWMTAGFGGALQYHARKDEAFYLFSGSCRISYGVGDDLETVTMVAGEAVHIPPGAVHQVEAITDCVMFETSTPVFDDRVPV